jgi:glycosyltransferase involved in cell wall biosynthesis
MALVFLSGSDLRHPTDGASLAAERELPVMRVAVVTNFCPHYRRPLFAELSRRMDLTVILKSKGDEWYWQGERSFDAGDVPTIIANNSAAIRRELRRGGYDAVVSDLTGRATLLSTVRVSRALDLPLVLWVGIWEHPRTLVHRFSRPFVRSLYRSADAIVTYGTHVSNYVERESGRTRNVFVAAQSVENEHFRKPAIGEDLRALEDRYGLGEDPTVVFVGRITEGKGIEYLIEACSLVAKPHHLVIAGVGPLLDETRELARSLGIGERVRFVGQVAQTDLPALLQASDVLVLPSVSTPVFREPWGLVVNEAMNCALPVLVTEAVGAAAGGLVVHDETGKVVPQRNSAALAGALEDLLADDDTRREMGAAASERVLAWNYVAAADTFEQALAAAVDR